METQDPLAKYMGRTDLKNIIADIKVSSLTSKNTGSLYYTVDLVFINGYQKKLFLKDDEKFAWVDAMRTLDVQNDVEKMF